MLLVKPLQLIANRENGAVVKILPVPATPRGIWVRGTADAFADGVLIEGFTTNGLEIRDNNLGNSGIYPQLSAQGLVRDNGRRLMSRPSPASRPDDHR